MTCKVFFEGNGKPIPYGIKAFNESCIAVNGDQESLYIVKYHENSTKELTIFDAGSHTIINIPSPLYYIKSHNNGLKYARRLVQVLMTKIAPSTCMVYVGSPDDFEIVQVIKELTAWSVTYLAHSLLIEELYAGNRKQSLSYAQRGDFDSPTNLLRKEFGLVNLADIVLCQSRYIKSFLVKFYHLKVAQVEEDPWLRLSQSLKNRIIETTTADEPGIKSNADERILLFSGRVTAKNGVKELISCFKQLVRKHKNIKLIVVGGGVTDKFLPLCYGFWNKIIFTGYLEKHQLYQLYKAADIGIVTSLFGFHSCTAMEMSLTGLPLVMTNTEGAIETYTDRKDCLFVKRDFDEEGNPRLSPQVLFKAIDELLQDDGLYKVLSSNAGQAINSYNQSILDRNRTAIQID